MWSTVHSRSRSSALSGENGDFGAGRERSPYIPEVTRGIMIDCEDAHKCCETSENSRTFAHSASDSKSAITVLTERFPSHNGSSILNAFATTRPLVCFAMRLFGCENAGSTTRRIRLFECTKRVIANRLKGQRTNAGQLRLTLSVLKTTRQPLTAR